ncbi:MAG: Ldh family oxidoreductase, partial [Hyphomicrobiales bacterium]|nr:Ldh family oxidoreductase [Hyphomicrobiales bacterium]
LPSYLNMIERGEINPKAQPRLLHDRAATFVLDGGRGFGPVAMMQAIAVATDVAHTAGTCFGLVRNTTHTGAIGRYAQWIAERGCVALIIGAGPAFVAYHGARVASLGTSPIAIAVPSGKGAIVLDMATSAISNGKILQALANETQLPTGTTLTKDGAPTTDPAEAEILLPLGGAKGSGLALMFEMFASVLADAPIAAPALGPQKRRTFAQNSAVLAVDIANFRPLVDFVGDADTLAELLKALPRQKGFDEILLPGERAGRTEIARRKTGIPIAEKLWQELAAGAKAAGVKMPVFR